MILDEINRQCKGSFVEHLGLVFTAYDGCEIEAKIELNASHMQPAGVVHGGVYLSMAETVAGAGSTVMVRQEGKVAFGTVINAQHLAACMGGELLAKAKLISKGEHKHIWDVQISNSKGKLNSICRVTNSIRELKKS